MAHPRAHAVVERSGTTEALLDVVAELLESEGYDAVQLRRVAQLARVSLTTIYKRFPTRDELIVCAMVRWMDRHRYAGLETFVPQGSFYERLMGLYRVLFEPWEAHPQMLRAFQRARTGPGGERLFLQGADAVLPLAQAVRGDVDPDWMADVDLISSNVIYALMAKFAAGDIPITDVLPTLERCVYRLTSSPPPSAQRSPGSRRK